MIDADYHKIMQMARSFVADSRPHIDSPEGVVDLVRPILHGEAQEVMLVVILDNRNHVIDIRESTRGLVDNSLCHPREIFRDAIKANASRIVVAHNHPSGDPTPSQTDLKITQQLVFAGLIIAITCEDHIIIGKRTEGRPKDWVSLRQSKQGPWHPQEMEKNDVYSKLDS